MKIVRTINGDFDVNRYKNLVKLYKKNENERSFLERMIINGDVHTIEWSTDFAKYMLMFLKPEFDGIH